MEHGGKVISLSPSDRREVFRTQLRLLHVDQAAVRFLEAKGRFRFRDQAGLDRVLAVDRRPGPHRLLLFQVQRIDKGGGSGLRSVHEFRGRSLKQLVFLLEFRRLDRRVFGELF